MGKSNYDYSDDETIELVKEYERYLQSHPGALDDFDEWLDMAYGHNKSRGKKVIKKSYRDIGYE